MALITIGTNLIDVTDIALIAPRGAECQVYLADGRQLASPLTAVDQATAANSTASGPLLSAVESENFGNCYIAGCTVQEVNQFFRGAVEGTTWHLRGGPGPVVCPVTDLAAAATLIEAVDCGGGGGGFALFWSADPSGINAENLEVQSMTAVYAPYTDGSSNGVVTLAMTVSGEAPSGPLTVEIDVAVPAGYPAASSVFGIASLELPTGKQLTFVVVDGGFVNVAFLVTEAVTFEYTLMLQYRVEGA